MTEKDEDLYRKIKICRFCKKEMYSDKAKDYGQSTIKYGGSAHNKCNNNVTQKQNIFIPFVIPNFSNFDCHLFFEKLFDKNKDKVIVANIPKTMTNIYQSRMDIFDSMIVINFYRAV